jgi:hypothetical protein
MTDPAEELPPETSRSVNTEKRPKRRAAKPPTPRAQPPADQPEGAPREGTNARRFWEYGQAYARGIEAATGTPCTAPAVVGPQDVIVRMLVAHCRRPDRTVIKGPEVLTWLEDAAYRFRSTADENDVKYKGGWTPRGLARWFDEKCPVRRDARQSGAAHIQVRRADADDKPDWL